MLNGWVSPEGPLIIGFNFKSLADKTLIYASDDSLRVSLIFKLLWILVDHRKS